MFFKSIFKKKEPAKKAVNEKPKKEITLNEYDYRFLERSGYAIPENAFLFHKECWAGRAESGINWIFLTVSDGFCLITRISFYRNDYAYVHDNNYTDKYDKKETSISCCEIKDWNVEKMISFINETFYSSVSKDDCIDEDIYLNWLKTTHSAQDPV